MKKDKDIEKYTTKIFKNLEHENLPSDFTDKLMNKILAEQAVPKKIKPFSTYKFMLIFSAVFSSFFLIAFLFPSGSFSLPGKLELVNNVLSNLQIDFNQLVNPIIISLKGSSFLKILPVAIIVLIAIEQILMKLGDYKKA